MTATSPWASARLGAIVDILDARRIPVSASERAQRSGDVPYYGAAGQVGLIDEPLFNEPLVLLGEDGVQFFDPFKSKAYLIQGPAWVNNHAHVLRARSMVDRRFLGHYLNQFDYRGYANGTTRLKLTQAAMRRIPVPLPAVNDQRWIVDILDDHLSRLDAADRGLAASLKRLEAMRLSVLTNEMQGPAETLGELALDAEYGTSTKCAVDGAGIPVARIPNIADGAIDMSDEKRAVDAELDLSKLTLRAGDVLIVRTNGSKNLIGRSAVVRDDLNVAFASYLIRYRFDERRVFPRWVRLALETPSVRTHLERLAASSAGQHNLGLKKLDAVQIPCPELDIQRASMARIIEQSEGIAALKGCLSASQRRSAWLRRGLLAAAFSGQLTGRFSDDEVIEKAADAQAGAHAVHVLAHDLTVPASAEPRGA